MRVFKLIIPVVLLLVSTQEIKAQEKLDPQTYNGNFIEYFTEMNIWVEGHMLLNYCSCSQNEDFLLAYQEVRGAYNAFLNSYINQLVLLNSRKALNNFRQINTAEFVRIDPGLNEAYISLERLGGIKAADCETNSILPTVVTMAELTQLATTVIDMFNDARKRREEQKLVIIQSLDSFKIPSSQVYECNN